MTYNWDSAAIRELIDKVKRNSSLYAKGSKVYKNQGQKNLAWAELGKTFCPPCPGKKIY